MCLIAFAIGVSLDWPLVVAANRDEFLERPTAPLAAWTTADGQLIYSGRDLRAGGTWLGATPNGRVAFLTNVRDGLAASGPKSRGDLVMRWLTTQDDADTLIRSLGHGADYAGFNLVVGDLASGHWTWLSNRGAADERLQVKALSPGVYGLSNGALNTPWPKTTQLAAVLTDAMTTPSKQGNAESIARPLWAALANRTRAPDAALPNTGVPHALEVGLSSAFVDVAGRVGGDYGTRCSTLLMARALPGDAALTLDIEERSFTRQAATGAPVVSVSSALRFQASGPAAHSMSNA